MTHYGNRTSDMGSEAHGYTEQIGLLRCFVLLSLAQQFYLFIARDEARSASIKNIYPTGGYVLGLLLIPWKKAGIEVTLQGCWKVQVICYGRMHKLTG